MVVINLGYTAPVNPPGASPVLTPSQVWTGLQYKVRRPERFVPLITGCTVVSETSSDMKNTDGAAATITRLVIFKPGSGPGNGEPVREVCKLYPPCRIDFLQDDGTTIGNYVTFGEHEEVMMTYVFQWRADAVEEGSEEHRRLEDKYRQIAKVAVEGSIQTIRKIFGGEMKMD
ncbi:DUF1857-domain-containing protein [Parathielavia appendiculata]|uniref:DUF1857-domain-containing protein n=1 Tax=Parathielavia appendiculata TaxID=2587402 RepID=A0AAN6TRR7_9PEZI|nr:DUF1857-domain-containing protein [Parathielavia appendiculata]